MEKKIHAREIAKKKNSCKEEGKEKNSCRRKVLLLWRDVIYHPKNFAVLLWFAIIAFNSFNKEKLCTTSNLVIFRYDLAA